MSAAVQLPLDWANQPQPVRHPFIHSIAGASIHIHRPSDSPLLPKPPQRALIDSRIPSVERDVHPDSDGEPLISYGFYRKHTENLLRRYLYASMQVGRSPSLLGDSVGRGWVSSRRVRTFEDAIIFVLDVERCLKKITALDRQLISRIILQEYTHVETAALLRISIRTITTKLPQALDRLTAALMEADLLVLPD